MATDKNVRLEAVPQMQMLMPLLMEGLASGKSVRFSPNGISMLPMLREGIDSVVLSPVTSRLEKYDIPLYQRDNGKFVLHRIVEVGECYTCMGDNQFTPETGIRQDQLIAVVTAFYRGEKLHSVKEPFYRLYSCLWHRSRKFRRFFRRACGWLKRHIFQ